MDPETLRQSRLSAWREERALKKLKAKSLEQKSLLKPFVVSPMSKLPLPLSHYNHQTPSKVSDKLSGSATPTSGKSTVKPSIKTFINTPVRNIVNNPIVKGGSTFKPNTSKVIKPVIARAAQVSEMTEIPMTEIPVAKHVQFIEKVQVVSSPPPSQDYQIQESPVKAQESPRARRQEIISPRKPSTPGKVNPLLKLAVTNSAEQSVLKSLALELDQRKEKPQLYLDASNGQMMKPSNIPSFWIAKSKAQEDQGHFEAAMDLFDQGADSLNSFEDKKILKEARRLFDLRMQDSLNMASRPMEVLEVVEEAPLISSDKKSEWNTWREPLKAIKTPSPKKDIYDDETPKQHMFSKPQRVLVQTPSKADRSDVVKSLVDTLNTLSLDTFQNENTPHNEDLSPKTPSPSKLPKSSGKKLVGVRVGGDLDGTSVTVLTPVRASRLAKEGLGVEKVITPVRRSGRLFHEEDYISGPLQCDSVDSRLNQLLESHGFAFVPNDAIPADSFSMKRKPRLA